MKEISAFFNLIVYPLPNDIYVNAFSAYLTKLTIITTSQKKTSSLMTKLKTKKKKEKKSVRIYHYHYQ